MMNYKMHAPATDTTMWTLSTPASSGGSASDDENDVKMLLDDLDDAVDANVDTADGSSMVMLMLLPGSSAHEQQQQHMQVSDTIERTAYHNNNNSNSNAIANLDTALWPAAHDDADNSDVFALLDAADATDTASFALETRLSSDARQPNTAIVNNSSNAVAWPALPAARQQSSNGAVDAIATTARTITRRSRQPAACTIKPKAKAKAKVDASKKPKRPPPSPSKARLRTYERRSRTKREQSMVAMKTRVEALETQIATFCRTQSTATITTSTTTTEQQLRHLALEAIALNHQNFHLRRAIDDHKFFHSMVALEIEHRDATPLTAVNDFALPHRSWRPLTDAACYGFMRESYQEIAQFSTSEDFVSSGLEIFGWREKRKLCGTSVKFQFTKHFAKDCSDDLATRSWEMRAVQDQVTRYFGPFLDVQVEVIQRIAPDVVVVRRKITHTQDHWVHHTIYLLFRTKTADGHLVCIRDMNPAETQTMNQFTEATTSKPSNCVIWSNCFIWWKFTTSPLQVDAPPNAPPRGFEVEYGGSLSSATSADAAFWMREVLLCAMRWENLVVGPLITL